MRRARAMARRAVGSTNDQLWRPGPRSPTAAAGAPSLPDRPDDARRPHIDETPGRAHTHSGGRAPTAGAAAGPSGSGLSAWSAVRGKAFSLTEASPSASSTEQAAAA
ncbi:hypothetical protein GCM10010254_25000 [Streptomyces chromofuscus]|nr:hypothetical protein GCM10010254_25000 [Streptomyces chromofuscus]